MVKRVVSRATWLIVGFTALALGAIGIALPLLPTTPFLLLAAFAFAESNERMHDWLVEHNVFGPLIMDWRRHGAISTPAKVASVVAMVFIVGVSLYLSLPVYVIVIQVVTLSVCAAFVVSRPAPPEK